MTKIISKASHPGISYSDEKYDANQGAGPLNPLKVASAKGELATMRRGSATIDVQFLHHRDQKQQSTKIRAQILHSENRSFLPTLASANCMQAALGTCAQLPTTWVGIGNG